MSFTKLNNAIFRGFAVRNRIFIARPDGVAAFWGRLP